MENKIITTSGGGALLSNDVEAIEQARFLATQAKDPTPHYEHTTLGFNYRLSNVSSAIGVGQLAVIEARVNARRENHAFYEDLLKNVNGITFLEEPTQFKSNRWLSCILIDPAKTGGITHEHIRLGLEKENIESRPLWKPMHLQPLFMHALYYGNRLTDRLFENGLCLPSGSNMTDQDKTRIASQLKMLFSL